MRNRHGRVMPSAARHDTPTIVCYSRTLIHVRQLWWGCRDCCRFWHGAAVAGAFEAQAEPGQDGGRNDVDAEDGQPDEQRDQRLADGDGDRERTVEDCAGVPAGRGGRWHGRRNVDGTQINGDGVERYLSVERVEVLFDLLDLPLYIGQFLFDGQGVVERLRLAHQRQQALLLGTQIFQFGLGIDVVSGNILHRFVQAEESTLMPGGITA